MKAGEGVVCPFLALVAWATAHRDKIKCPAGLYSEAGGLEGVCAGMSPVRTARTAGESSPEPPAFRKPPKPKAIAVSIREAAEMVGVCAMTLKREIDRGHLRGFKIGRTWRIRVAELESYLKRSEERQARR